MMRSPKLRVRRGSQAVAHKLVAKAMAKAMVLVVAMGVVTGGIKDHRSNINHLLRTAVALARPKAPPSQPLPSSHLINGVLKRKKGRVTHQYQSRLRDSY